MREFSVVSAEVMLKARAECLLTPVGLLMGLDTVADCMNHEALRPWFGHLLQDDLIGLHIYDDRHGGDYTVIADAKERAGVFLARLELDITFFNEKGRNKDRCDKGLDAQGQGKPFDGRFHEQKDDAHDRRDRNCDDQGYRSGF